MRIHTNQQTDGGFTLLETCISMVLFLIVLTGIVPLCVYAMKYNSAAAIRAGAITIAQRKLEQLRGGLHEKSHSCRSMLKSILKPEWAWQQKVFIRGHW